MWDEWNTPALFKPPGIHKFPFPSDANSNVAIVSRFFHDLTHGQLLPITDCSSPMQVIHTPRHTTDPISLYIPADRASDYTVLYPGHGPIVAEGAKLIGTYIAHRLERETQLVSVIKGSGSKGQPWSTWGIVSTIYAA